MAIIEINKNVVRHGDVIEWRALNLIQFQIYRVGILVTNENVVHQPKEFLARMFIHQGTYTVPNTVPIGDHQFVLQRKTASDWVIEDFKPITVTKPEDMGGGPGGGFDFLTWITKNWRILVIILFILFLVLRKK
jgi:hypothetical protein